jgi:hypothetical protein
MTHLPDRTRRACHGGVGAAVGSSSRQGVRISESGRYAQAGVGNAHGLAGAGLNPSWFMALPQ